MFLYACSTCVDPDKIISFFSRRFKGNQIFTVVYLIRFYFIFIFYTQNFFRSFSCLMDNNITFSYVRRPNTYWIVWLCVFVYALIEWTMICNRFWEFTTSISMLYPKAKSNSSMQLAKREREKDWNGLSPQICIECVLYSTSEAKNRLVGVLYIYLFTRARHRLSLSVGECAAIGVNEMLAI